MSDKIRGPRPDLTTAQIAALVVGGLPLALALAHTVGVFDLNAAQLSTLTEALKWGAILSGLLIIGDAILRTARNGADARVKSTVLAAPVEPHDAQAPAAAGETEDPLTALELATLDIVADLIIDDDLPSDDEETAAAPPPASTPQETRSS